MKKFARRLIWRTPGQKFNPLMYPFLLATFVYGFGFAFFGGTEGVKNSSLYMSLLQFHELAPFAWGLVTVLVSTLVVLTLLLRPRSVAAPTALLGFMTWLFAAFVYILSGHVLVILTVTGPYMFFWAWFYWRVAYYQRQVRAGDYDILQ